MSDPTYMAQRAPFLQQLRDADTRRAPDFHAGGIMDWSPAERGNELAGEVGELCNELKKLLRFDRQHGVKVEAPDRVTFPSERGESGVQTDYVWNLREKREAIVQRARLELGDVMVCIDLVAAVLGVDVEAATREKFNATSDKIGSTVRL